MNDRRSFFKQLAIASVGAIVAPSVFVPHLTNPKWKRIENIWILNPKWKSAPYEYSFIIGEDGFPLRWKYDDNGERFQIVPSIKET